jgi:hypothetical protein
MRLFLTLFYKCKTDRREDEIFKTQSTEKILHYWRRNLINLKPRIFWQFEILARFATHDFGPLSIVVSW